MTNKKKILIMLPTNPAAYPFSQAGAFSEIAKHHDVYLAYNTKNIFIQDIETKNFKEVIPWEPESKGKRRVRVWMMFLNMWGNRSLAKPFGDSYRRIFEMDMAVRHPLYKWLLIYIPGITKWTTSIVLSIAERLRGEDKSLAETVDRIKPDLMVGMLCGYSSNDIEPVKIAKKRKIPIMYLQAGWDNVPHRGFLTYQADYLGVWGYQSAMFAELIHGIPKKRMFLMGAPFAEILRRPLESVSEDTLRRELGLPLNKKILFFAGISHASNEVGFLKLLEKAIESGELPDTCVFYRPHPYRQFTVGEDDYFAQNFKHVFLDPVMKEKFRSHIQDKTLMTRKDDRLLRDYEYNKKILLISSAVVSPISTFIAEALYLGVPCVLVGFVNRANERYKIRYDMATSQFYHAFPGLYTALTPEELVQKASQAVLFEKSERHKSMMQLHLNNMAYQDDFTLGERILNAVNSIFSINSASTLYPYFHEPMVDVDEKDALVVD